VSAQPKNFLLGRGERNGGMACPHCYARGFIYTQPKKVKGGTSGGRASGALLPGGIAMLATFCANCEMVWHV
jgi:hypothetical protein